MALPVLRLDLAPPSNLWRRNHGPLGLAALGAGAAGLALALALVWRAQAQAQAEGRRTAALGGQAAGAADLHRQVAAELRAVDVARELPRWRLAEKLLTERSLPWSRLTAELERGLVDGVRLRSIQRTRSADLKVQLKLKGEALTRAAEAGFVRALQKNPFFEAVLLDREGAWNGAGVAFECTLAASMAPPPFAPLPRRGGERPVPRAGVAPAASAVPAPGRAGGATPDRPAGAAPARPSREAP